MRTPTPFFGAVALLSCLGPTALRADPTAPDYAHAPAMISLLHWPRMPVRVGFVDDNAATPEREKAALDGFSEWVKATGSAVHYQQVSDMAQADVVVRFDLEPFVPDHPGAVGHTDLTHDGPRMVKADMVLATAGVPLDELQLTAAHEFGHALGINGHSDAPDDMMAVTTTRLVRPDGTLVPTPPRAITARDLNTLWLCYPSLRPGAPPPPGNPPTVVIHKHSVPAKKPKKR